MLRDSYDYNVFAYTKQLIRPAICIDNWVWTVKAKCLHRNIRVASEIRGVKIDNNKFQSIGVRVCRFFFSN